MLHPKITIPALSHLTAKQLKKLDLVSSLFPNIPPETLIEQLMLQSPEQSTNPGLAAIRDFYPGPIPQHFEDIVRELNDNQISFEDFQTNFENFRTHLEANPRVRQILEEFRSQLRDENPELENEVEGYRAFIEKLDGVFNPPQSEAAIDAAATTGVLETPVAEVIIGAQVVSNIEQFAEMYMFKQTSAFAGTSILARIIWRNLKHLQDFYKDVGKLRGDVESLNQKYESREITPEEYESRVEEATRKLEEIFPETVSTSLDTIYPNWTSKVLGIKEEYRSAESNPGSANPEPSGDELAQVFIERITDGDFHFAAVVVDYIAPSMTESYLDSFLTEVRNSEDPGGNVTPYEAAWAEWFIQFDNSYFRGLNSQDSKALATKLFEIKDQLSPDQFEEFWEVQELYWRDPFSVDAAWKDKAIDWFSTLNEDLHKDIQEAYEIVNPTTHGTFRRAKQLPRSGNNSDNSPEPPHIPDDSSAPRSEIRSPSPLDRVREDTEPSPEQGSPTETTSPLEQIVNGLYNIRDGEKDSLTELTSPRERIAAAFYGIGGSEKNNATEPISPPSNKTELPEIPVDNPSDPSET